jgi:hypothetical protein
MYTHLAIMKSQTAIAGIGYAVHLFDPENNNILGNAIYYAQTEEEAEARRLTEAFIAGAKWAGKELPLFDEVIDPSKQEAQA